MPLRLKEVHIINQPYVFNMIWQIFKPFIKEKLKNRVSRYEKSKMVLLFLSVNITLTLTIKNLVLPCLEAALRNILHFFFKNFLDYIPRV